MGERIKILRKKLGLTQQEFAEKLSIKRNTIAKYETGRGEPIDAVASLICREFGVSEDWLKTGTGEMFLPKSREDEITQAVERLLSGETSEFKRRFTLVLSNLKEEHWVLLEQKIREMVEARPAAEEKENGLQPGELKAPQPEVKKIAQLPKAKRNGNMIEIKVYDQPAAAGLGNYLDDPDFHIEQYPEHILPSGTDFGVLIDGDSMEPKIHDGYTVFVEAMPMIDPGQIGIFVLNGKSYCKKLAVDHEKRQTLLVSLNPEYEDIVIQEFDSFRTLGHVLGQWGIGSREDDFLDWKE